VEVLFERICRENGIVLRHGKPRSPTTTGKIERFHKTLRAELLDHVAPFESLEAAQAAIDGWVHAYNHQRPHQALEMAVPASRFRPNGPAQQVAVPAPTIQDDQVALPWAEEGIITPPVPVPRGAAVEFEARVPPSGMLTIVSGRQAVSVRQGLAGRTLTIWADLHSIHLLLDGHVLRTVASRLLPQDLACLAMRGARQAGPEPAKAAIQQRDGKPVLAAGQAVEIDRKVHRDGHVIVDGEKYQVGTGYAGTSVTVRLDGHLMHAIADGAQAGTWPCPVTAERAARMNGARAASAPLPPPPLPAGAIAARRRVHPDGRIMVNKQPMKLGPRHAGKLVTVIIEDTCYRILHGEEELAVKPRKDTSPITRLYVRGMKTQA
jgi:hypothetical protein